MPFPGFLAALRSAAGGLACAGLALAVAAYTAFVPSAQAQSAGDLAASLSFQPAQVASGKPSKMRVRLRNTNDGTVGGIRFDVVFVPGMRLLPGFDPSQCNGGSVTPVAGGFAFRGGFLDFDRNECDVAVDVAVDTDQTVEIDFGIGPIESRNGDVSQVKATLTVSGGIAPKITSPLLATPIQIGVPFVHVVTVTGTAPVVVTADGLPPGLAYDDTTRTVTGAPNAAGIYAVTLRATNGFLPADAQVSTVEVRNPPLTIVTPAPLAPQPVLAGFPAKFDIVATGGLKPYRFELAGGELPPGLAISQSGAIGGTPTQPGTYPFVVRVRDTLAQQDQRAYELTVARIPTTIRFSLAPNPAVAGQVVVLGTQVEPSIGPPPPGTLDAWAAGPGTRCPSPFDSGVEPVTPITHSVPLAGGFAQIAFGDLAIGRFRICAAYSGSPLHQPASIGPIDLFVIKGILLPSPKIALDVPGQVQAGTVVAGVARVDVGADARPPGGAIRVRAGAQDLGDIAIIDGTATFSFAVPESPGTLAVTAAYAGDPAWGPASAEPAYVSVVKASLTQSVPSLSDFALASTLAMLALAGAIALRRRRA